MKKPVLVGKRHQSRFSGKEISRGKAEEGKKETKKKNERGVKGGVTLSQQSIEG